MIALVNLLLAAPAALAQDSASAGASASTSGAPAPAASNTPPFNSSAPDPWWPQYPENRSVSEFMMNSSASDADLRGETDIAQWIVAASNLWRNQFESQNVTWNETCARIAKNHTDTCLWEHWGNDNLAMMSYSVEDAYFDVRSMTFMWADEWTYYPFSHPEEEAYSHFTAMTWNESNTVGCSWNVGCANDTEWPSKTFFVCNYWPPSNVAVSWAPGALFAANVRNYTGWPVDEAKQSSIDSLIAEATSSIIIVATRTSGPTTTTATNTGTQRPQATSTTSARTTTRTGSNGANSNSAGSLQVSAAGLGTALAVFLFTSLW